MERGLFVSAVGEEIGAVLEGAEAGDFDLRGGDAAI